jgi:SAM-dependent methyltransferase
MQPCASTLAGSVGTFVQCFQSLLATSLLVKLWRQHGPKPRGQTLKLSGPELVQSLVFHVLCGVGTLAAHVQQLTGVKVSDSDLSQRRAAAGVGVFEAIVRAALHPLATLQEHPSAFYRGWRLVAIDGSQTSVSNTPQLLRHLSKAASRRFQAAFAKVPLCWLVELGTHTPLAVVLGLAQESEWALAHRLLAQLPAGCLLLADRLYGVGAFVNELLVVGQTVGSQWLVRVRQNVNSSVRQVLADGSALVAVVVADPRHPNRKAGFVLVRQIVGRVRRPGGAWVTVRLWTSLLDASACPAAELLALYARRWDIEVFTKELKVDLRGGTTVLQSHTLVSAAQEILALVLAMALLSQVRLAAATTGAVAPLRISFGQTLALVRSLWWMVAVGEGILAADQVRALVARTLEQIAAQCLPPRRARSCARGLRQPVQSWPRLTAPSYQNGPTQQEVLPAKAV